VPIAMWYCNIPFTQMVDTGDGSILLGMCSMLKAVTWTVAAPC
jgi:hypothetical protein